MALIMQSIYIEESVRDRLRQIKKETNVPAAANIRLAIDEFLDRNPPNKKNKKAKSAVKK